MNRACVLNSFLAILGCILVILFSACDHSDSDISSNPTLKAEGTVEENELPIIPDGEPVESGAVGSTQSASAQQAANGQSGAGQAASGQAAAKQSAAGGQVTSKAAAAQAKTTAKATAKGATEKSTVKQKTTAKGPVGGKTTAKPATTKKPVTTSKQTTKPTTGNYIQIDEDGNVIHLEENELPILPG